MGRVLLGRLGFDLRAERWEKSRRSALPQMEPTFGFAMVPLGGKCGRLRRHIDTTHNFEYFSLIHDFSGTHYLLLLLHDLQYEDTRVRAVLPVDTLP